VTAPALDAGSFAAWYDDIVGALRHEREMTVPCGSCRACCTSAQFVHISPDETDTLAHVPSALRFPAPGLPEGHVVLGYDEHGRCPMLVDDACSIYDHRPRTCRTYDCRVFAATGVDPGSAQPAIAERVAAWRFAVDDRRRWDAVRAAVPADGAPLARALRGLEQAAS
jgi:Fe-S-cluster containining protein